MHTEVDVPNPDRLLVPGMYAEATFGAEAKNNVLDVPLQAVSQQGDQTWVYVVSPGNQVEDRPIKVGLQTSTEAEVVSGLAGGESVIVSDRSSLKPGQEVRPQVVQILQYQGTSE